MEERHWHSRRSPVLGTLGVVASSQPLASQIGIKILEKGGNAADAAVAVAAALNVTEPTSTGIGGDCFCLYYSAKTKTVRGLNGSGRAPSAMTLSRLQELGIITAKDLEFPDPYSVHTVTVPGTCAGWIDTIDTFGSGKLSRAEIFGPAIELAEKGFPVSPITAHHWEKGTAQILRWPDQSHDSLIADSAARGGYRAPRAGEIFKNPNLAKVFREVAEKGKDGFYDGWVAQAIVSRVKSLGGLLTLDDLKAHRSELIEKPLSVEYHGVRVWELPPNGQGLTVLIALNLLKELGESQQLQKTQYQSAEWFHLLIESLRVAFADTRYYVSDPEKQETPAPIEGLLSNEYARERVKSEIDPTKTNAEKIKRGIPQEKYNSTVYFSVVDAEGNACSFINSNYMGFGTGIIPLGCGFTLQNRGANFSLDPLAFNALAPSKRPFHTIIPGMATVEKTGELYACFGVMGGFMQPQGHVQVLVNMIDYGMDPQEALDRGRFCILDGTSGGAVGLEVEGIKDGESVVKKLQEMGHEVRELKGWGRSTFGRGQIIWRHPQTGVMWAGSDPRADGMAIARS